MCILCRSSCVAACVCVCVCLYLSSILLRSFSDTYTRCTLGVCSNNICCLRFPSLKCLCVCMYLYTRLCVCRVSRTAKLHNLLLQWFLVDWVEILVSSLLFFALSMCACCVCARHKNIRTHQHTYDLMLVRGYAFVFVWTTLSARKTSQ